MTWQSLTTYAGSVLTTGVVTQFLKELKPFRNIPTRIFSFLIALILLFLAEVFTSEMTLARGAIIPINAMVVSLASNGAYDALHVK